MGKPRRKISFARGTHAAGEGVAQIRAAAEATSCSVGRPGSAVSEGGYLQRYRPASSCLKRKAISVGLRTWLWLQNVLDLFSQGQRRIWLLNESSETLPGEPPHRLHLVEAAGQQHSNCRANSLQFPQDLL